ncbi:hypothetical protein HPB50_009004 [Hyalomma asiaticum]|uniref:Uncharacterized protein n=1 Tax=Hyalomma asiaticum TaxID=266040 RepID=A0ACB7S7R0_HYAAI|nr:hypothetical protein HPB50_009004 [Hyalomma asiaticum]
MVAEIDWHSDTSKQILAVDGWSISDTVPAARVSFLHIERLPRAFDFYAVRESPSSSWRPPVARTRTPESYYVSHYQDSAIAFTVHETPRPSGVEALPSAVSATEGFGYGRRPFISAAT